MKKQLTQEERIEQLEDKLALARANTGIAVLTLLMVMGVIG